SLLIRVGQTRHDQHLDGTSKGNGGEHGEHDERHLPTGNESNDETGNHCSSVHGSNCGTIGDGSTNHTSIRGQLGGQATNVVCLLIEESHFHRQDVLEEVASNSLGHSTVDEVEENVLEENSDG